VQVLATGASCRWLYSARRCFSPLVYMLVGKQPGLSDVCQPRKARRSVDGSTQ